MADKKISQMALLSAVDLDAAVDYLPIVDPSEPAAADQNKRILVSSILTNAVDEGTILDQSYIGTAPNEIPLNANLGGMAYQSPESVVIKPQATAVPNGIGDMIFQATSDSVIEMEYKGSDAVVRTAQVPMNNERLAELSRVTPLRQAVRVAMTAAASGSNGIQVLDNANLDMGTNNFTLHWEGALPDWTPASDVVLLRKHNGTNGYILSVRTTGVIRLQINYLTYDSTVAITGVSDGNFAEIDVAITRETASVAGQILFLVNGVQIGTAVSITAFDPAANRYTINNALRGNTNSTTDIDAVGSTSTVEAVITDGNAFSNKVVCNANDGRVYVDIGPRIPTGAAFTLTVRAMAAIGTDPMRLRIGTSTLSEDISASQTVAANDTFATYTLTGTKSAANIYLIFMENGGSNNSVGYWTSLDIKVSADISNAVPLYISGTSTTRVASDTTNAIIYNRALSAAEVLSLCVNGPALADTVTPKLAVTVSNPTFTDSTGWTGSGGASVAAFVSGGEITISTTTSQNVFTNIGFMPAGGRVHMRIKFRSSGSNIEPSVRLSTDNFGNNPLTIYQGGFASYASQTIEVTIVNTTLSRNFLWLREQGGVGGSFIVDEVQIWSVGITGQWSAENAQSNTGQIFDSSGNKNHALLPAAGATIIGKESAQLRQVRWTNTWAGTNELQYIGGVNQAILPANAYIESIIGTVSGATPHDIIIGDGSDTDRYVTITTGLAAGTTSFTLANRTTDGTNLKLTVDPDTDATMSIAWVITYTTLE